MIPSGQTDLFTIVYKGTAAHQDIERGSHLNLSLVIAHITCRPGQIVVYEKRRVDPIRLDAVKHFYGDDTVRNVEVLSWVNDYVKFIDPNAYIVGECWDGMNVYAQ
mgnify:CR=1 FL=1